MAAVKSPIWKRPPFIVAAVAVVATGAIVGGVVASNKARSSTPSTAGANINTAGSASVVDFDAGDAGGTDSDPPVDTEVPTAFPTPSPTPSPTEEPTASPTSSLTSARPSSVPSSSPSSPPTLVASAAPSSVPTTSPSASPTSAPSSSSPTTSPSASPTIAPSSAPTIKSWGTRPPPKDPDAGYFDYDPCEEDRRRRTAADEEEEKQKQKQRSDRLLPELTFPNKATAERGSLGLCEGDCDDDVDCEDGLVCHQRDGDEPVPGCSGRGVSNVDHCTYPTTATTTTTTTVKRQVEDADADEPISLEDYCEARGGGSGYGPKDWGDVSAEDTPEYKYWGQYQEWIEPNLGKNECNSGGDRQSPIDLRYDYATAECLEYHEIRDKMGDYAIDDSLNIQFEIHPTKLRIAYHWEPEEKDSDVKDAILGPSADVPKGWGDQLPVLHVDIKIPSEHTIEGKRFAMEYQVFLIQNWDRQRGAPAFSVLFDVDPRDENRDNAHLQRVLNMWQMGFDADATTCEQQQQAGGRRTSDAERPATAEGGGDAASAEAFLRGNPDEKKKEEEERLRELQKKGQIWNPWDHEYIFTSEWFFGYEGSLTEPPCTSFVEWRVIDTPAYLSSRQLSQIKGLIFDHVDPNRGCAPNTQFHRDSVARPVQPLKGRNVHRCTCRDFLPKVDRQWYDRNRCWEGDEHVFHEEVDGHWKSNPATRPDRQVGGVYNCNNDPFLSPPCCGATFDPFHECCAEGTC